MTELAKWLKFHEYIPAWASVLGVLVIVATLSSYVQGIDSRTLQNQKIGIENKIEISNIKNEVSDNKEILIRIDERVLYLIDEHKKEESSGK